MHCISFLASENMQQSFDGLKVDNKFLSQLQLSSTWKRLDIAKDKLFKGGIGFTNHVCIFWFPTYIIKYCVQLNFLSFKKTIQL